MKLVKSVLALSVLAFAGAASAQDCGNAVEIFSNTTVSADTCTWAGGSVNGVTFDHVLVYKFDAMSADALLNLQSSPDYGVVVSHECKANPAIDSFGATQADSSVISDGTTGYVYIFPADTANTGLCGDITLQVDGTLPVALQKFSVN